MGQLKLLLLSTLALAGGASADPHPMGAGQHPVPTGPTTDIAIARERLTVRVQLDRVEVRAELAMVNRAAAARVVDVGFPCDGRRDEPSVSRLDCRTRISVKVAGRPVATKLRRHSKRDGDWTWTMRFAPGQEIALLVEYTSKLVNDRYQTPFFGMSSITYRLTTGATWAGPIGVLDMSVSVPVDLITDIGPLGYQRSARLIVWQFKDYTPTEDVTVSFAPMYAGAWHNLITSKKKMALEVREQKAKQLESLLERFQKDGAKETIELRRILERHLAQPPPPPERVERTVEDSVRLLRAQLKAEAP